MISFNNKLIEHANNAKSLLCVGLDINPDNLESNSLSDLIDYSKIVIDYTRDYALAYKPNFAFFERWGSKGFIWLEEIIEYIGEGPILIADAKRGDIGNTAKQYAESVFTHFGFDCITLNPYLGRDSIEPFLCYDSRGVFILCKTSNGSGPEFQNQIISDKRPLYQEVAYWANDMNKNNNIGLVVGATYPDELQTVRDIVPELPILVPGIGAQGGDLEKCVKISNKSSIGIINVSRSISFPKDKSKSAIGSIAESYMLKINRALNERE